MRLLYGKRVFWTTGIFTYTIVTKNTTFHYLILEGTPETTMGISTSSNHTEVY